MVARFGGIPHRARVPPCWSLMHPVPVRCEVQPIKAGNMAVSKIPTKWMTPICPCVWWVPLPIKLLVSLRRSTVAALQLSAFIQGLKRKKLVTKMRPSPNRNREKESHAQHHLEPNPGRPHRDPSDPGSRLLCDGGFKLGALSGLLRRASCCADAIE